MMRRPSFQPSSVPVHLPSLRDAAQLLDGEVDSAGVISCPGPGHSHRDRSLRVWLTDGEISIHSFAGDDPIRCRDYVRDVLGLPSWDPRQTYKPLTKPFAPARSDVADQDTQRRREVAQALWARAVPCGGSLAETYLRSRGIALDRWPTTLRLLPARPPDHLWPAMVAAYGLPSEPEPGTLMLGSADVVGVQLTYLRRDGFDKAPIAPAKRSIGRGHTMPMVLAPITDSLGLVIAEGIEDALSLHIETGLGAWAAGGASRLPGLAAVVLPCVEVVTVVVDDDEAGRTGAAALCDGLHARNISTSIIAGLESRDGASRR